MNNARMIDLAQLDELARRLSSLVPPGLREGREELIGFLPGATTAPIGFIYDDSNPVGRVHLGVLHVYAFTDCPVVPAEVHSHRWAKIEHIIPSETVETWSRIAAIMLMECSLDDQDSDRQTARFPDQAAVAPDC